MSKLAIFLCAVLFASAANASFVSDQLEKAQGSLNNLLENSISKVKSVFTGTKRTADELSTRIEEQAHEYGQAVADDVKSVVEKAEDDVDDLINSVHDVDVSLCTELTNELQYTADIALLRMKECFVDKRTKAAGYIDNVYNITNSVLDRLNQHKYEANACMDHIDGVFSASKALVCTNLVGVKAAWTVAKVVPSISVQATKLGFLLSTLPPTLTYCTTISALSTFYYESSIIASKASECIQQKINEVRNIEPDGLDISRKSTITSILPEVSESKV